MASYLLFDPPKATLSLHCTTILQQHPFPASFPCSRITVGCQSFRSIWPLRGRILRKARLSRLRHIILDPSAHLDKDFSSDAVPDVVSSDTLDANKLLVVGEGVCIASATAAFLVAQIDKRSQESHIIATQASHLLVPRRASLPAWHNVFVLLALIVNIFSRTHLLQGRHRNQKGRNSNRHTDSILEDRVQKLEADIGSNVTIVRMLSKQVEKLSVRFRVTRQTLRDPIQQATTLAQKTSESLNILAGRAVEVEKELSAIQDALIGMQENQSKQLELISTIGKLMKHRTKDQTMNAANNKVIKDHSSKSNSYHISNERRNGQNADLRHLKPIEIDKLKMLTFGKDKEKFPLESSSRDDLPEMPDRVDYWLNTECSSSKASQWPVYLDQTHEGSSTKNIKNSNG